MNSVETSLSCPSEPKLTVTTRVWSSVLSSIWPRRPTTPCHSVLVVRGLGGL